MNHTSESHWPPNVGILAIELYVPSTYVAQTELEKYDGVSAGKYTVGLGQDKMGFCSDREDINSLCLTVVQNLLEKHNIDYSRIGRLDVGTETILDKSKSVKSVLMKLFESCGNTDIEGLDTTNACYGGTAALLNAVAWLESSSWDGRLALVVAGDIAVYAKGPARPTGGTGAVAILVGPNAPITFERGFRATHASHVYDFYKPDMESEYPRVDGKLSIKCYLNALDVCYKRLSEKAAARTGETLTLESFDALIFHSPYCKLVQKSLARLLLNDVVRLKEDSGAYPDLMSLRNVNLEDTYFDTNVEKLIMAASKGIYEKKTKAGVYVANQVGNMYTASVYGGLVSYLSSKPIDQLLGNRLGLFSYGSGLQASMYTLKVSSQSSDSLAALLSGIADVRKMLDSRKEFEPEAFEKVMSLREGTHHKAPYTPVGNVEDLRMGTYYISSVDDMHRREYKRFHGCSNSVNNH